MRGIRMNQQPIRILRDREVGDLTKLSKTTRWRLEKSGSFPKRLQLSKKPVASIKTNY